MKRKKPFAWFWEEEYPGDYEPRNEALLRRFSRGFGGRIPAEVSEKDDYVVVRVELPGFRKENIKVKATETTVRVFAEKFAERKDFGQGGFMSERSASAIRRAMNLPSPVRADSGKARYRSGILEVTFLKKSAEKILGEDAE